MGSHVRHVAIDGAGVQAAPASPGCCDSLKAESFRLRSITSPVRRAPCSTEGSPHRLPRARWLGFFRARCACPRLAAGGVPVRRQAVRNVPWSAPGRSGCSRSSDALRQARSPCAGADYPGPAGGGSSRTLYSSRPARNDPFDRNCAVTVRSESAPRYLEIAPTAIWRSVCVKGGGKLEGAVRLVLSQAF